MGETRDDQFLALPEEASQFDIGLQVDYGFNPDLFYQYGVIASGSLNGVFGQAGSGNGRGFQLRAGVVGWSQQQPGVLGWSRNSNGVDAESVSGPGLSAVSFWGPAVNAVSGTIGVRALGQSLGLSATGSDDSGVLGVAGAPGPVPTVVGNIAGVVGSSGRNTGTIGTSTNGVGVVGYSATQFGVYGETGATGAGSYAGYFKGDLFVSGKIDAGVKDAIVPFPDGTHRLLHCMESPEHWFEDFGTAKLKRGHTIVKLDADFAKVIKRGDYRVFLTPEGDCRGLYVRRKSTSFEVREFGDGKSSVAFSYRIIGRRRDIARHRRFAKIETRVPMAISRARMARPARRLKAPPPTPAGLHAFAARMAKLAGAARMPKRGRS